MKPLILAHSRGKGFGKENSLERLQHQLQFNPDIVELDLRKSRDNVIFCYHGSIPLGYIAAYFLQFMKYKTITKLVHATPLTDYLKPIKGNPVIYCDIKQRIPAKYLHEAFKKTRFNKVWLTGYSLPYLGKLKKELGKKYTYGYNYGLWLFHHSVKRAKLEGIDIVQLFRWQWKQKNIEKVKKLGLKYSLSTAFIRRKKYEALAKKHNSLWISYDVLEDKD